MTKSEFLNLSKAITTYYPRFNIFPDKPALELWFDALQDMDYKLASVTLKKWVATEKWPPTIAELRKLALETVAPETGRDWGDAWRLVNRAVRNYGSWDKQGAMSMFDDITAQAVNAIGWDVICQGENESADRAVFRDVYNSYKRRAEEDRVIPKQLKDTIHELFDSGVKELDGSTKDDEQGANDETHIRRNL